jgi:ATP-dependent protease ClpP protease subunit
MPKDLKYTENPSADVPKMFIDKEIGGKDEDGQPNILGNDFLKELMYLSDEEGKTKVEVWINSPGGIVTEGQSIYASILHSFANVNTVCYGIAASIAGVIFQAGKKRIMYDYAHLMYHPAYSDDGRVDKGLEALNNAICKMIATRTGKTEDEIWAIMNRGRADDKGTWISAEEALANGFCDEIIRSDSKNRNSVIGENTAMVWKAANKVLNRATEKQEIKPKKMNKVLNKSLGLHEEASEDAALAVVNALNKSMESLKEKYEKAKADCDDLKKEMDEMKKKNADEADKAKAKADEEAKAKATAEAEAKNKEADDTLKNAVSVGRIKNDATVIASFKNMYLKDPEATKAVIESLPITKQAPVFNSTETAEIKDSEAEAIARKNGLTPGTAKWYNAIKQYNLSNVK